MAGVFRENVPELLDSRFLGSHVLLKLLCWVVMGPEPASHTQTEWALPAGPHRVPAPCLWGSLRRRRPVGQGEQLRAHAFGFTARSPRPPRAGPACRPLVSPLHMWSCRGPAVFVSRAGACTAAPGWHPHLPPGETQRLATPPELRAPGSCSPIKAGSVMGTRAGRGYPAPTATSQSGGRLGSPARAWHAIGLVSLVCSWTLEKWTPAPVAIWSVPGAPELPTRPLHLLPCGLGRGAGGGSSSEAQ